MKTLHNFIRRLGIATTRCLGRFTRWIRVAIARRLLRGNTGHMVVVQEQYDAAYAAAIDTERYVAASGGLSDPRRIKAKRRLTRLASVIYGRLALAELR